MSSIDDVIARRARGKTDGSNRKQFTVAREKAIEKMRKFAMADPHYYILELIQAAISNGAKQLNIVAQKDHVGLSYTGGGYTEEELAQLFDFLFAPKQSLEHGDLRSLAIGINALMLMEPKTIEIRSGDGTAAGTTKIEIQGRDNVVSVERGAEPLDGTLIWARGLRRRKVWGKSTLNPGLSGARECEAIETRCMAAPVPFILNDDLVFGASSMRTPYLLGYSRCVSFDEGDLYGTIGIANRTGGDFKLLIHGVLVQTLAYELKGFADSRIGGVVSFDRLNKTADHAGIVHDEVLAELWIRLRPYAQRVMRGESGEAAFDITAVGEQDKLTSPELRRRLKGAKYVVTVPCSLPHDSPYEREWYESAAEVVARALEAPAFILPQRQHDVIATLAGPDVEVIRAERLRPGDAAFYQQPRVEAPARPWLAAPIDVQVNLQTVASVNSETEWRGQLYTPAEAPDGAAGLRVRLLSAGRLLWQGRLDSDRPGHHLDLTLPSVTPSSIAKKEGRRQKTLAKTAREAARLLAPRIRGASEAVLGSLVWDRVEPGSLAAHIVLAHLAEQAQLHVVVGEALFGFRLPGRAEVDLATVPILRTVSGRAVDLRGLEMLLRQCWGLIYGVVEGEPASIDGLDADRILALDAELEALVIGLVGEAAYVRLGARAVVADHDGLTLGRIELGLREYPNYPLLVDGFDEADWPEKRREAAMGTLVDRLQGVLREEIAPLTQHAWRHLVWHLNRSSLSAHARERPLYLDGGHRLRTHAELEAMRALHVRWRMFDGRALEPLRHGTAEPDGPPAQGLAMNSFLRAALGADSGLVDAYALRRVADEAVDDRAAIVRHELSSERLTGWLALGRGESQEIFVKSTADHRVSAMGVLGARFGVFGRLETNLTEIDQVVGAVRAAVDTALQAVLTALPDLEGGDRQRAVDALLARAEQDVELVAHRDGRRSVRVFDAFARIIIDHPMLPGADGNLVSAADVGELGGGYDGTRLTELLAPSLPVELWRRLEQIFGAEAAVPSVGESPARPTPTVVARWATPPANLPALARALGLWLERLRPDAVDGAEQPVDPMRLPTTKVYFVRAAGKSMTCTPAPSGFDAVSTFVDAVQRADQVGFGRLGKYVKQKLDRPARWSMTYTVAPARALLINEEQWLVRWALASDGSDAFAALLLASYACINAQLLPVTNDHELIFQARLIDQLPKPGAGFGAR